MPRVGIRLALRRVAERRPAGPGGLADQVDTRRPTGRFQAARLGYELVRHKRPVRAGGRPRKMMPMTRPASVLARLRRICLALPEAREKLSHGEPTWFAGTGKVFAALDDHHHGAAHLSVWLPQPLGAQEALIASDPDRFFRPPYVGPSGWVGVVLDTGPDWAVIERLVRDAYVRVARPRLRRLVTGENAPRASARRPPAPRGRGRTAGGRTRR